LSLSLSLEELEALALEAAGGPERGLTAAEIHGAAVGIGAADPDRFELQDLVDLLGPDVLSDAEAVERFVTAALDALYAPDMSFTLLLPEDDAPMPERLVALSSWCQSFLAGLAAGLARKGVETLDDLPEEVREIIRDFAAIGELDTDLDDEEAEADFVELEEYAKVGVLLVMSLGEDAGDDIEE